MRKVFILLIFLVFIITLQNCNTNIIFASEIKKDNLKVGSNLPISRALAAKMISLLFNTKDELNNIVSDTKLDDVNIESWYYKYVNFVTREKIMDTFDNKFLPENPLTLKEAQKILDKIDKNNKIKLKLVEETKDMPISYSLWCDIYCKIKDKNLDTKTKILEKNYIVLATSINNTKLKNNYVITDKGLVIAEGILNDSYIDKEIKVLEKDGEIIAILNVVTDEPTIKNAYIVNIGKNNIIIFSGGAERTYKYNNLDISNQDINGKLCDIKIKDSKCLDIKAYDNIKKANIKIFNNDYIETETETINIDKDIKVYSIVDGKVKWKKIEDLVIGIDCVDITLKDNKAIGCVIKYNFNNDIDKIRVLLNTTNFESPLHKEVILTSTTNFKIIEDNKEKKYNANEIIKFKKDEIKKDSKIYIKPENNGLIEIKSIKRSWPKGESPKYRGTLEIRYDKDGIILINELPFEEYLYSVIPSEMPYSYGLEAAKIQAVIARSFAYNNFLENNFSKYGANVDDSVKSQVYNNTPENNISTEGVNSTKGIYILFNDKVADTRYFSTSCGVTANNGEVWADKKTNKFPTTTLEYLKSKYSAKINKEVDLSKEEKMSEFIKDKTNIKDFFDSCYSWFRWDVEMTLEEIEASINKNLKSIYDRNPDLIKVLQKDGRYESQYIDTIGKIIKLEVLKRGQSGNLMELKIIGTKNTIIVLTEYNIRNLIKPKKYLENGRDIKLNRIDKTQIINYGIMPSAFYIMEEIKDDKNLTIGIKFYGGGNGHGVGLSQNGAKTMIDRGYKFDEILTHYYSGVKIGKINKK